VLVGGYNASYQHPDMAYYAPLSAPAAMAPEAMYVSEASQRSQEEADEAPLQRLSPEHEMILQDQEDQKVRMMQGVGRRGGVAAQSVSQDRMKDYVKPVYPKTQYDKDVLLHTIKTQDKLSVLFGHLDYHALEDVVNAFFPVEVPYGYDIIRQGDDGDRLYVINQGEVDIFVRRGPLIDPSDRGQKVVSFGPGALFGELALMYSQPRAATVTVVSNMVALWALDRDAFQMLLAANSASHLAMYEGWLSEVPLFKTLNHFELSRLAECLEDHLYDAGEVIMSQGAVGDEFYILEDGSCSAYIYGEHGEVEVKQYLSRGEYFGEIALLAECEVRRATVRATGQGCAVVSLSKSQFTNLLGPLVDLLRQQSCFYPEYASFMA